MKTLFVKPSGADIKVRMPERDGDYLPDEGMEVPENKYYMRRIIDGDIKQVVPTKKSQRRSD